MRSFTLFVLLLTAPLVNGAPQVVATLKPLQLIAQAVTEGVSEPHQLLSAGASPHDYQLRPSDIRTLQAADLVLWVGPVMEPFLQKPIRQLEDTRVITLLEPAPEAGNHGAAEEEAHDRAAAAIHGEHEGQDAHHHPDTDPHLWLSPRQGILIAQRLSEALSAMDPAHADAYEANLTRFTRAVEAVDEAVRDRLAPLREQGYFVFHDGYSHFESHYRLNHLGAFTLSPQHRPGARQLNAIRRQLEASQARCVFSEPQFTPRLIKALTEGLPVRQGSLDPLGGKASSYPEFLHQLGEAFADCLSAQ